MTKQQIKWASEHDWFIEALSASVIVRDEYMIAGTCIVKEARLWFNNFEELKAWARY